MRPNYAPRRHASHIAASRPIPFRCPGRRAPAVRAQSHAHHTHSRRRVRSAAVDAAANIRGSGLVSYSSYE